MKKSVLAVEFDDYIFKFIQARPTAKGWLIEKFGVENIKGKQEGDLVNAVKNVLQKLKVKKLNNVLVIPRSLVTVRYLQLPTNNPNELCNMIDMQAVRQIPYTKEEMVYDYYITGLTEESYTKVFLVIIKRDIVLKYIKILEMAGITPYSIELESLSIMELCRFLNAGKDKVFTDEKPVALLDIDYSNTNIIVMQNGAPTFTRAISIGAMHLRGKIPPPEGKDWLTEWVEEINRSLIVFQREQTVSIDRIIVLGENGGSIMPMITGKLSFQVSGFDITKIIEGIPLPGTDQGGKEGALSFAIDGISVSIFGLLGAIRQWPDTSVNLIPEEIKRARISKLKRKSLALAGLLMACIIGMSGFTLDKKIDDRKEYLSSLENRLHETSPMAKELALKKERLSLIKKQLSVSGTSLDILRELYSVVPQKTSLNVFIYDDSQGITIKGTSPTMSEVFDLMPKLENSKYFENVTNRYATQRKIRGQELTEFHIDCSIAMPEI